MHCDEIPNRLINEKSPYLLQHAYNPVDWYSWSSEAFNKAKAENKPIFLSIGYSTCHWCHVMERESFEDEEVAKVLNKFFVCIKVDREERPDIDSIYMKACQFMIGQGGWPLSIFLTPDQKPFYAATYIPKKNRYGIIGIVDLAYRIHEIWVKDRESVFKFAESLSDSVSRTNDFEKVELKENIIAKNCLKRLERSFDKVYGGFGDAPKFPVPQNLMFLMRYYSMYQDEKTLGIVEKTLEGMLKGGIYDHIGGGFARYSTDDKWLVPHFEKMLYDNALLVICLSEIFSITHKSIYKKTAEHILSYIKREMTQKNGGFFSAVDADSEGVEGKYYLWSKEEIIQILGENAGNSFCDNYDITPKGNFEGKNIPNLIQNEDWKKRFELDSDIKQKLLEEREKRIHPHKDDKILTGWNGLMIAAYAMSGKIFDNENYLEAAKISFEFIENTLIDENDRLYARFRKGEKKYYAYADDYAFMLWAALELYDATYEMKYLERSKWYGSELIQLFWDNNKGGLFFYGNDSEKLITNPKEASDNALPSGNSVAAYNLIRLGRLTNDEITAKYGEKIIEAFSKGLDTHPEAYTFMISALLLKVSDYEKMVVAGEKNDKGYKNAVKELQQLYKPFVSKLYIDTDEKSEEYAQYKKTNETALYICKDFACQAPVVGEAEILEILNKI